jgi:hypothetical protein
LLTIALGVSTAKGDPTLPTHWKREDLKKIYFAPQPDLKVSLTHLGADDEFWDQLNIDVGYTSKSIVEQIKNLEEKYPGFEINRVVLSKTSNYHLNLPALNVDLDVDTMNGIEGPYFRFVSMVSKANSAKVKAAYQNSLSTFVKVTGNLTAQVPVLKVLERLELDDQTCDQVLPKTKAVFYDVLNNLSPIFQKIEESSKYPVNASTLKKLVVENCVMLPAPAQINSFRELLSVRVAKNNAPKPLVAEHRAQGFEAQSIPLQTLGATP